MRFLMILVASLALGCGDDDSMMMSPDSGPGEDSGPSTDSGPGTDAGDIVPPDSRAVWLTPEMQTFDEAIPGIGFLSTVFGDRMSGAHETFVRVTAGMGLPPHAHTMGTHSLVVQGPMQIPVPSNETDPAMMMTGMYGFVPPGTDHQMNCLNSAMDCLFLVTQAGPFDFTPTDMPPMGDAERDPAATLQPFSAIEWVDIIPGVVEFGPVRGEFMAGEHATIVRVQGGMGIPPHWHTMMARGFVLSGMVEVPVPYNQTDPMTMPSGSYFAVPPMAEHEMNCMSDTPCMFYLIQDGAFDFNPVETE